ncbi:MAG TPA: DUF2062 domain-containing protein [Polyangiaceae bacterium]
MDSLARPQRPEAASPRGIRAGLTRAWRLLRGGRSSPAKLAAACALGLFVGCLPLYGLHFPICLGLCLLLRLDMVVMYLAANISNPFVAPFLLTAEVEVGSWLLRGESAAFDVTRARELGASGFLAQAAVGSLLVGAVLAGLGGGLVWLLAGRRAEASSALDAARERTLARYGSARIADRKYVEGKLRFDPVLECIADLEFELGEVVDAGAGRGQLALCLLDLGKARSVRGFDLDERKIEVARRAAGDAAGFEVSDLTSAELSACDTLLLIDVLHYLEASSQDALLARAARSVRSGGRILIRDTDGARKSRGLFTRAAEQLARVTGWHRSRQSLCFRPLSEIVARLETLGFRCRTLDASRGTPFSNQLIVAERLTPSEV